MAYCVWFRGLPYKNVFDLESGLFLYKHVEGYVDHVPWPKRALYIGTSGAVKLWYTLV